MSKEQSLDQMLDRFAATYGPVGAQLRGIVDTTPGLRERMEKAINHDQLTGFGVLPPDAPDSRGAEFGPRSGNIYLGMPMLERALSKMQVRNELRLITGHELGHAEHRQEFIDGFNRFVDQVQDTLKGPGPHDYTKALTQHAELERRRECDDNIAGFNTLAGWVRQEKPQASLAELYKSSPSAMGRYINFEMAPDGQTAYTLKPGFTLEDNLQMPLTAENVKAMDRHFYQASDYPMNYVNRDLEIIAKAEHEALAERHKTDPSAAAPEVRVDLSALGVHPQRVTAQMDFIDTSNGQRRPVHGQASNADIPPPPPMDGERDGPQARQGTPGPRLDDPAHPGHELFRNLSPGVDTALAQQPWTAEQRGRITGALAAEVANDPLLQRVGRVVVNEARGELTAGNLLTAAYEPFGAGKQPSFRASVDVAQAAQQPLEHSGQQVAQGLERQQQQELARQQAQQQGQQQPTGPVLG